MIRVGEAAKILGVSIKTLQRWDNTGLLKAKRTPTNHRFYTIEQLEKVKSGNNKQERS